MSAELYTYAITFLLLHLSFGEEETNFKEVNYPTLFDGGMIAPYQNYLTSDSSSDKFNYSFISGDIQSELFRGIQSEKSYPTDIENLDTTRKTKSSSNGFNPEDSSQNEDSRYPDLPRVSAAPSFNMEGSEIGDATFVVPDEPGVRNQVPAYEPPRRSYAVTVHDGNVTQNDVRKDNGEYIFSYTNADGSKRKEVGRLENNQFGQKVFIVRGSYDYIAPDGQRYRVHYQADSNGYRILSNKPVRNPSAGTRPVTSITGGRPSGGTPVTGAKRPEEETQKPIVPFKGKPALVKPFGVPQGSIQARPVGTAMSVGSGLTGDVKPIHGVPLTSKPSSGRPPKTKPPKRKRPLIPPVFPLPYIYPTKETTNTADFIVGDYPFIL